MMKFSEELTLSPVKIAEMCAKPPIFYCTYFELLSIGDLPQSKLGPDAGHAHVNLEKVNPFLDDSVCKMTVKKQRLNVTTPQVFNVVRSKSEEQVAVMLCSKLGEFFKELESYN